MIAADLDVWRFQTHPEVWLIVAAVLGFGAWIRYVLGPKAVRPGETIVSRANKIAFTLALILLWLASDWPMHDIAEEYLYAAHMVQHMVLTLIVPPLFLLATPEWLGRLIVSRDGSVGTWVRRLTRPVAAAVLFNVLVALTHLTFVVNTSIANGVFHYFVHLTIFIAALLMWMPVASPLPELRAGYAGQGLYLFLNSVLPTVPGGFLTFAQEPLYRVYDHPIRLWGITVTDDQQAAGLIMKLGGGFYIWLIIGVVFFKWVASQRPSWHPKSAPAESAPESELLTYEDLEAAFARAGEPIHE